MTQSEFGIYSNFATWLTLLSLITTLNLQASLFRAQYDFQKELNGYISSILALGTISVSIFLIFIKIRIDFFEALLSLDRKYIYIIIASIICAPALSMYQVIKRFQYEYKKGAAVSMAAVLSSAVGAVIGVMACNDKLWGRIIGGQVPLIIVYFLLYIHFMRSGKRVRFSYWKYAVTICIPYTIHLIGGNILNAMDRIVIIKFEGAAANALYSLAYSVSMVIWLIMASMNDAFMPWLGEMLNNREYEKIKEFSIKYLLVFSVFLNLLFLGAPEILLIFGGKQYMKAMYVMPPVILGYMFNFLYMLYVNVEQYEKKTKGMAIGTFGAALFNLVSNLMLVPRYGYIAAAYTTLFSYFLLFMIHYFNVKRMNLSQIYSLKAIGGLIAVEIPVMFLTLFLYKMNLLRYLIAVLYIVAVIVAIIKYKKIHTA